MLLAVRTALTLLGALAVWSIAYLGYLDGAFTTICSHVHAIDNKTCVHGIQEIIPTVCCICYAALDFALVDVICIAVAGIRINRIRLLRTSISGLSTLYVQRL